MQTADLGWHCDCVVGLYSVPIFNRRDEPRCWNCGQPKPERGTCPIRCGCRVERIGLYEVTQ